MEIYLVGGAVRDKLLHRTVTERDWVVVGATPEQMLDLGYQPVGQDFPVFLHPQTKEEYALARTERKSGRGYKGFTFHTSADVSLIDDLKRRDLTINAMAMADDGRLIDPFHGQQDLEQKLLRHVSNAFVEDPVRILRVARFYARFAPLGFAIANETMQLMRAMVINNEVDYLVPERICQEMFKALQEPAPEKFFEALRSCGALRRIFPELDQLYGVPNKPEWHPEIDSGVHNMMVLQQATRLSDDVEIRFAALLHDLGKGITDKSIWPSHHGHEEKGVDLVKQFCQRLKAPKNLRDIAILTSRYHGDIHKAEELRPGTIHDVLANLDAFRRPERFEKILLASEADAKGRPGHEDEEYPQRKLFMKWFYAAKSVDIKSLVAKGYQGEELKAQIRQVRIKAIKGIKRES